MCIDAETITVCLLSLKIKNIEEFDRNPTEDPCRQKWFCISFLYLLFSIAVTIICVIQYFVNSRVTAAFKFKAVQMK